MNEIIQKCGYFCAANILKQSGNFAEATLPVFHVTHLPKLLHIIPFEPDSEQTECVYIHFLWTNNLHSIRLLNKPLSMVAEMENGKWALANVPL